MACSTCSSRVPKARQIQTVDENRYVLHKRYHLLSVVVKVVTQNQSIWIVCLHLHASHFIFKFWWRSIYLWLLLKSNCNHNLESNYNSNCLVRLSRHVFSICSAVGAKRDTSFKQMWKRNKLHHDYIRCRSQNTKSGRNQWIPIENVINLGRWRRWRITDVNKDQWPELSSFEMSPANAS